MSVLSWASTLNLTSFGIIAHSQGGMVALTIMNYYHTPLNLARNIPDSFPVIYIQSVGTPYKGTPLADDAASIANFFGSGCGANSDLSIAGAANWITGITRDSIISVFYYTTTSSITNTLDICSRVTDIFMSSYNDGITELSYAMLPDYNVGRRYMGNKVQQCHTTDMNYIAQYLDQGRNRIMNFSAGR